MNKVLKLITAFFQGNQRTVKAKKHILALFVVKGLTIVISFAMVPVTLNYVQKEQYGIWLALASFIEWFSFFDVGLGNGLRNKLAESWARDEVEEGRIYVSTAYTLLTIIFGAILVLFYLVNPFLDWTEILNTAGTSKEELTAVMVFTFSFFCIRFVLKLIFSVFYADQRPSLQGVINLIRKALILVIIIILTNTTEGSLFNLAFTFGFMAVLVLAIVNIYFFNKDYKAVRPSFKLFRKAYVKDLLNLGVKFFVIGISVLVIFSTDNIIIIQLFGPEEVPAYNIAYKYFGLITIGFGIICTPFWSAFTEAYTKNDIKWIKNIVNKLVKAWFAFLALGVFLLLFSDIFFHLWVPEIEIPFHLSVFMLIYVVFQTWGSIYIKFLNGVNKVNLQLIAGIVGAIINIPLSIFLAKTCGLGTAGVILASTVSVFYGPIIAPIQYKKIIEGKAKGIWNR